MSSAQSFSILIVTDIHSHTLALSKIGDEVHSTAYRDECEVTSKVDIDGKEIYDFLVEKVVNKLEPSSLHKPIKKFVSEKYTRLGLTLVSNAYRKEDGYCIQDVLEGHLVLEFNLPLILSLELMDSSTYEALISTVRKSDDWLKSRDEILTKNTNDLTRISPSVIWMKQLSTVDERRLLETRFTLMADRTCKCEDICVSEKCREGANGEQVFFTKHFEADLIPMDVGSGYLIARTWAIRRNDTAWASAWSSHCIQHHTK